MIDFWIMFALGLLVFVFMLYIISIIKDIEKNGAEASGIVYEVENDYGKGDNRYPVIRFVTQDEIWITEPYKLITTSWLMKPGRHVTIIYDLRNPKRFYVKLESLYIVLAIPIILSICVMAYAVIELINN